jgi:hypothetical protein
MANWPIAARSPQRISFAPQRWARNCSIWRPISGVPRPHVATGSFATPFLQASRALADSLSGLRLPDRPFSPTAVFPRTKPHLTRYLPPVVEPTPISNLPPQILKRQRPRSSRNLLLLRRFLNRSHPLDFLLLQGSQDHDQNLPPFNHPRRSLHFDRSPRLSTVFSSAV